MEVLLQTLFKLSKTTNVDQILCDSLVVLKLLFGYSERIANFLNIETTRKHIFKVAFSSRSIDLILAALDLFEPNP